MADIRRLAGEKGEVHGTAMILVWEDRIQKYCDCMHSSLKAKFSFLINYCEHVLKRHACQA